ncbi:MAG: hydantoinase/oxoprolinase family protein [Solirubrobacterales bacterium]|nr:hydantoinase/oxoprolinase family protein [Solirubrobacterales bacterium]
MAAPDRGGRAAILGVDVGGTFTDAVLIVDGDVFAGKAPTTPADQSLGAIAATEVVLDRAGIGPGQVTDFAHGMTVATNALLEAKGARTALIATRGFADLVEIGRQNRAELYRLQARRPAPLVPPELRIEADERTGPEGPERPLAEGEAEKLAGRVAELGVESVAVCLLHADRYPGHEQAIGEALRDRFGDQLHVSLSHEVVGTFREYERAATTEVDASLSPLLGRYLSRLEGRCEQLGLPSPLIMQSSGGLTELETARNHAALSVLSGPAGGAAASALVAAQAGEPDLLCFDMGGTSCDVCVVSGGTVAETGSKTIGGRPLALPMVDIDTVGAGGGSIAWRDSGGALRVGPGSAGALPGPACYGQGGTEPTVTDANLVLGRLDPEAGLAGGVGLDSDLALDAVSRLARDLGVEPLECAEGILGVAVSEMVRALRVMTVERGLDPRDFALLAFGGAGPLHAAAVADQLDIDRILIPRTGGVFSALGLAAADRRSDRVRTVLLDEAELSETVLAELIGDADEVAWDLRYRGQSFELTVADRTGDPAVLRERFEAAHLERYGYVDPEAPIELVTVRRRSLEAGPEIRLETGTFDDRSGPAVIDLEQATVFVPPGWTVTAGPAGLLRLQRRSSA